MVRGIVLAGGASSRMGRPKAALPLSDRGDTFLSRVLRTFEAAGVPEVVVVTGADPEPVRTAAGPIDRRIRFAHNPHWEDGQVSSLLAGLAAAGAEETGGARLLEAILVTLVDVPLVSADTMRRVLQAWRSTGAPIVRPARGDEHGHPVLFDRALFGELAAADHALGAKSVVRAHAADVVNVPIDDDGAFRDIDTEEDYRAIVTPRR
jgi:molybdenum cofactor cytidylyltransferase